MKPSPRAPKRCVLVTLSLALSGCGTVVPHINEAWEGSDVDTQAAIRIKEVIFCEVVKAVEFVQEKSKGASKEVLPDNYGVQMQTAITIDEHTTLTPSLAFPHIFPNASQSGVTVGQSSIFGFGANASTTATRVDTSYSYYLVGKIGHGKNKAFCDFWLNQRSGSSLLMQPDLGIQEFLFTNATANSLVPSSKDAKKDAKADVLTYEVKFALVSNGNFNPMYKLVNVSGNGATPLIDVGRTRTHDLILTFGPNGPDGKPSQAALNQNLSATINSVLRQPR